MKAYQEGMVCAPLCTQEIKTTPGYASKFRRCYLEIE